MSIQSEQITKMTSLNPDKALKYDPNFQGDSKDSTVIAIGNSVSIAELIVHKPIGGHKCRAGDWVISTRGEFDTLKLNSENPHSSFIQRQLWTKVLATAALVQGGPKATLDKVTSEDGVDRTKTLSVLKRMGKELNAEYPAITRAKKAAAPPKPPTVTERTRLAEANEQKLIGDSEMVMEIILMNINTKENKIDFTKDIGPPPYVTYKNDVTEEEQVGVPYLYGLPESKIRATMMKFIVTGKPPIPKPGEEKKAAPPAPPESEEDWFKKVKEEAKKPFKHLHITPEFIRSERDEIRKSLKEYEDDGEEYDGACKEYMDQNAQAAKERHDAYLTAKAQGKF